MRYLAGGLEHGFYFSIYWEESSQPRLIFFRVVETTNQYYYNILSYGFQDFKFP